MQQTKKYDFRVVQKRESWTAEITRRVTSRKIHVSKRQSGFATEAEAQAWGEKEIKAFSKSLKERNERSSKKRNLGKPTAIPNQADSDSDSDSDKGKL